MDEQQAIEIMERNVARHKKHIESLKREIENPTCPGEKHLNQCKRNLTYDEKDFEYKSIVLELAKKGMK